MTKRRHAFARDLDIPGSVQAKVQMIRGLTLGIKRLARHFLQDPRNWRDARSRESLRRKIEQRTQALNVLEAQDPELAQILKEEV